MSTHNICFHGEIRNKYLTIFLSGAMICFPGERTKVSVLFG